MSPAERAAFVVERASLTPPERALERKRFERGLLRSGWVRGEDGLLHGIVDVIG